MCRESTPILVRSVGGDVGKVEGATEAAFEGADELHKG